MIKINLLPVRATKKKEAVQRHVLFFVVGLVAVLGVCAGVYAERASAFSGIQQKNAVLTEEINNLKKIIGEVDVYRAQKELLEKKLGVIRKLKADKTGPVHMLDELASRIPEKLWLESLEETDGRVEFEGISINNEVIATFMSRLEESVYFSEVYLVSIEAKKDDSDLRLKQYQVTARLVVPTEEDARSASKSPKDGANEEGN